MNKSIYASNKVPTANIAVNKSRLKVYKNAGELPTYYLQKGQEFQIELANPTTDVVLAKIILNGKAISQGGLVLNPGQRVFLDRYIDVAKKFLFDTYEVSGSDEMKVAIANNGDFKVEFYRERQPYFNQYNGTLTIGGYNNPQITNLGNYYNGTDPQYLRGSLTSGSVSGAAINGILTKTTNITNTIDPNNITNTSSYYSNSLGDAGIVNCSATLDMLKDEFQSTEPTKKSLKLRSLAKKSIETGRVEKGSDSDQELKYVNKSFEYFTFHTVEYKMLPISQKINTVDDLNVKRYCGNCGRKQSKGDNFCSGCGKQH